MGHGRTPAATDKWERTSPPVVYEDKTRGRWRLFLNFSTRPGDKARRKPSRLFDSKEEAVAGKLDFRMSWEDSHRGKPYERKEGDEAPSLGVAAADTLPAGKSTLLIFENLAH